MAHIYPHAFFGNEIIPIADASLSIASSAVLCGLSVYTVFPISKTNNGWAAFRLQDHFQRLIDSAQIIGIDTFAPAWSTERFMDAVRNLFAKNNPECDVFVRVMVHVSQLLPGTRSRGLSTTMSMFMYDAVPIVPQDGMRLKTSVWRRVPDNAIPARAKVNGAYVNSVLAKQDALDSGYDDCIFLDADGHICEASAANIFIVRNGVLITPDTGSDILEGINRRTILHIAHNLDIPTQERPIDLTESYIADEVFLCGTSAFIAPVTSIDGRTVGNGSIGIITARLREIHAAALHGNSPQYESFLTYL